MSGIFGFINLDGRPVTPEYFSAMAGKMKHWGPDGVNSIISGGAAFGHSLLIVTHESRFEKMPVHDRDKGILFTAAARLDNRDELCDIFSIDHPERPVTSDGQLVLQAYKKWGADSCKHLFGDWSFAAWHIKEQRLFLARDHLGNTGLYYYFKPPLIVFASSTEGVLAHPEVPRMLNEMYLAERMMLDYSEANWSQTYWKDVRYLPAAHSMAVISVKTVTENYWHLENAPAVRFGSDEEYLKGFLDHFRRAVRVRLNSIRPIGTMLSAGLDSSSVTALAAEEMQKSNRPLVAYTAVPLHPAEKLFPGRLVDEWALAHEVAKRYGNIEHVPIHAEDVTPLAAIGRSLSILHEPQHAVANMFWLISMFDHARNRDIGVMLTGQLGNGGISWSGGHDYIFYLFVRNQWLRGSRALTAWKESRRLSWFGTLKSQLVRPALLPLWSEYQRFIHRIKQKDLHYSYPRNDFIKRMNLKKTVVNRIQTKFVDPLTERILTTIRNGTITGTIWPSIGSFYRMDVRDPSADIRLLEYCMGVPDEQNTFAGGQRMLIRRAMVGILPDSVRWNTKRGKQAADATLRLIDQYHDIEKELARLESAPEVTRYLDIAAMKNTWKALLSRTTGMHPENANALLRAMQNGYFLLSFYHQAAENDLKRIDNSVFIT